MCLCLLFKHSHVSILSVQTLTHPRAQVAFSAELSPAPASRMLLDDVSLRAGACTPTGSCDFESGQCTWLSHTRAAPQGHHWVHADGHTQGPKFDHTTHTPDGEAPLLSHHFGAVFFFLRFPVRFLVRCVFSVCCSLIREVPAQPNANQQQ